RGWGTRPASVWPSASGTGCSRPCPRSTQSWSTTPAPPAAGILDHHRHVLNSLTSRTEGRKAASSCCNAARTGLWCTAQTGKVRAARSQEITMNYQYNEQFAAATRQFADAAARINHLALENAQKVFGLQLAALEENAEATFSFLGQAADVRDLDGLKTLFPKGVQIARENVERVISVGQEVLGATVKTNEAIAELARTQIESATAKAQDQAQGAVAAATKASKRRRSIPQTPATSPSQRRRRTARQPRLPGFFVSAACGYAWATARTGTRHGWSEGGDRARAAHGLGHRPPMAGRTADLPAAAAPGLRLRPVRIAAPLAISGFARTRLPRSPRPGPG